MNELYGKYRAIVTDNKDPKKMGRIKVSCPKVYGDYESPWCLPCSPIADSNGKGFINIPKANDPVWIEFEEGNSHSPIWVGAWWKENTLPSEIEDKFILKTKQGHEILIDDKADTIKLTHKSGVSVTLNDKIVLSGNISIKGNISVNGTVTSSGNVSAPNIK